MRKFVKKSSLPIVVIPELGRVREGDVLEGDHYAKYVPQLLVEVFPAVEAEQPKAEAPKKVVAKKEEPKVEVAPVAPAAPVVEAKVEAVPVVEAKVEAAVVAKEEPKA
jgi:hypothetical protein